MNTLSPLGYKILLDRYALKDTTRSTLAVGDTVLVIVDRETGQREVGIIYRMTPDTVTISFDLDPTHITYEANLKHYHHDQIDKPLETTPLEVISRVALAVAEKESDPAYWAKQFIEIMDDWKFVPAGRILAAAGNPVPLTYYNCYVLPSPHDSREGIFERLGQMAEIMSRGGGVGLNLSSLRPKKAYVKGVNGRSSGSVSWGSLFSNVTGLIEQGGSRRGALMLILEDWHPDILDFIEAKKKPGYMENANISVGISDEFMKAVATDSEWLLYFPDTTEPDYDKVWDGDIKAWVDSYHKVQPYAVVQARLIWNAIIESAWASAEPGIWFTGRSNSMSNSYYFNHLIATNPCGEQPLPAWSVCNLGSINLSKFVSSDGKVMWVELEKTINTAVRFLDNVIDVTPNFYFNNVQQQYQERRIGLNTMGLAEMLIKLKIRYGSPESLEFISELYEEISFNAYWASIELAEERGSFPAFEASKFLESGYMKNMDYAIREKIKYSGIRNVTLLTQAPNGTIGTMVG